MVDVGANWGYFSLLAAAIVGREGRVISLEPDPRHFAALQANVRLNGFSQVRPIPKAAGAAYGVATLAGYDDGPANRGVSRLGPASDGQPSFQVECVPIDGVTAGRWVEWTCSSSMSKGRSWTRWKGCATALRRIAIARSAGTAPRICFAHAGVLR